MPTFDTDDLRTLLAISRTGRLADAAERLGVDASTVWRRVRRLENVTGEVLFDRQSGWTPTPLARDLVEHAERIESEHLALRRTLEHHRRGPVGHVRLTLPETLLPHIASSLNDLLVACPDLTLAIDTSSTARDLDRNEAHVALRTALEPPPSAIATRLATIDWAVHHRTGSPDRWIAYGPERDNVPAVRRHRGLAPPELEVTTVAAMRHALDAGLGRGLLPTYHGVHLAANPVDPRDATGLWLLHHPDHRRSERVRAVVEHLRRTVELPGRRTDR